MSESTAKRLTLYGFGDNDRSSKVRWTACELGLDIDEQRVTPGKHHQPPYADMNAYRHIPTAEFGGRTLRESTAICHTLAEAFDDPKLWVGRGEPGRERYLYWLGVFGETFESRLVEYILGKFGVIDARFAELHEKNLRRKMLVAAAELPGEDYLAGENLTVADILAGYSMRLAVVSKLVDREVFEPYLSRLVARPAAQQSRMFASLP